jgi:stress response protein YsnF
MTTRRSDSTVIPVHEEEARISKRTLERRARIDKKVHTRTERVEAVLRRVRPAIERIPVNREVPAIPAIRHEGDTLVIPVVEEVLVVERRLMLREEVRVRSQEIVEPFRQDVSLRAEQVVIDGAPLDSRAEASPTHVTKHRKDD